MPEGHEIADAALHVDGALPTALSGRYLCLEPNRSGGPRVHSIVIHGGAAGSYRRRLIHTRATNGAATTNLIDFAGRTIALADGAVAQELSPTLETRPVDAAGRHLGVGAYPKRDSRSGDLHLISSPGAATALHHILSAGGMTRQTHSIDNAPAPVLDLAITRDRLVLLADGFVGITDLERVRPLVWLASRRTQPGRIAGAYDDGEVAVVHLALGGLEQWIVSGSAATLDRSILDATRQQPSRLNEQAIGAAHRYLYSVGGDQATASSGDTTVFKHDLSRASREDRVFAEGRQIGEFLFVADPPRHAREDGGWLLGPVHDTATDRSRLVVLDAADITGPIVASVDLPRPITRSLRGLWSPSTAAPPTVHDPSPTHQR